ncbi:MAG: hypothetical protein A2010_09175 [Nitrospirae bacterium GWD2_57_9]|nr:MAG: hypothetical protein A2010_09175 [Nitrospirae bacterium GWD2_57_9]OGW49215.1 MAG: hypothetical protein A2078_13300 [Nitrospirae bacterium GWC2_57_9]
MSQLFDFRQCITLLKSTGSTAKTLAELRDRIGTISEPSLYHHTYQYFLKGHILEYTNDFAEWAGQNLEERELAEELSNVDPYDFPDINELREELLRVMGLYLERFPEPRETRRGEEFYFNETITLVFPAGVRAKNLAEFLIAVKYVDRSCLYYHFYDSRYRLGGRVNDFSQWLADSVNKKELAERLMEIDPFVHSLEGIRERIVSAIEAEVRFDMESAGVHHEVREELKRDMIAAGGRP